MKLMEKGVLLYIANIAIVTPYMEWIEFIMSFFVAEEKRNLWPYLSFCPFPLANYFLNQQIISWNFLKCMSPVQIFLRSSHNRVDRSSIIQPTGIKLTNKREQYDWIPEKIGRAQIQLPI